MKESSVSPPPFHNLPADTVDPVMEGVTLGTFVATRLAGIYALVIAIFIMSDGPASVLDFYMGVLVFGGFVFLPGIVPAFLFGALGGGTIGWVFQYIKTPLPRWKAIHHGFWLSLFILIARIGIFGGFQHFRDNLHDPIYQAVWVYPNIIAFFGLWWVTVKINETQPIQSSTK